MLKKIGVIAVCVLITLQVYPMYPSSVFKGKCNIWLFFFICILTYNIIIMTLDLVYMLFVCLERNGAYFQVKSHVLIVKLGLPILNVSGVILVV